MTLVVWMCLAALGGTAEAEAVLRRGDVAGALMLATQSAEAAPGDVAAQELQSDLLVAMGMAHLAEQRAITRLRVAPQSPDAHYLHGRALQDVDGSEAAYAKAAALSPKHARAQMGLGSVNEARGKFPEAVAAYGKAVSLDQGLAEAWLGQVRVLLWQGNKAQATVAARTGLGHCPDEPGLALVLAGLAEKDAPTVLIAAIRRVPDEPRLHEAFGRHKLAAGDALGALGAANAALNIAPMSVEATALALQAREVVEGRLDPVGVSALMAAQNDPAALNAIVAKYPKSALAYVARGMDRRQRGDAGGLADLLEATKLDPQNIEALGSCGVALVEAKRPVEAEPMLRAAASMRPWDPSLGLVLTRVLLETGRKDEATIRAAELAKRFPYEPSIQVTHAGLLVDAGRSQDAYRVVKAAMASSSDPRLVAALVRIAPAAGQAEEAAQLLDQLVAQTGSTVLADAARKLRQVP